jgi:hypothetical protein
MKNIKNDIMGVKNISVLIGENENNFMGNLYNHGLPIFANQLSLK